MKHFLAITLVIGSIGGLLFLPRSAEAVSIFLPFGGKVISIIAPGVTCTQGEGPITIRPVGIAPTTPYAVTLATKRYLHSVITPGVWILGLYNPIPNMFVCATDTIPPVSVPVFPIFIFGTSLPSP